jgi:hypothetical protein
VLDGTDLLRTTVTPATGSTTGPAAGREREDSSHQEPEAQTLLTQIN